MAAKEKINLESCIQKSYSANQLICQTDIFIHDLRRGVSILKKIASH